MRSHAANMKAGFVNSNTGVLDGGGSSFNDRDMGGNFHFTSFAALGAIFGPRDSAARSLRIQHTSNGGLNSTNPGVDVIGLNITFNSFNR